MIRLVATDASVRQVQQFERTIGRLVHRLTNEDRREIRQSIADGFGRNFDEQRAGSGAGWAALKPATIADRLLQGFPPTRPILERTGDYRATLEDLDNPEHYSLARATDTTLILEEASNSPLYAKHEGGLPNMAARPAGELGQEAERILGQTVERLVTNLLGREGL